MANAVESRLPLIRGHIKSAKDTHISQLGTFGRTEANTSDSLISLLRAALPLSFGLSVVAMPAACNAANFLQFHFQLAGSVTSLVSSPALALRRFPQQRCHLLSRPLELHKTFVFRPFRSSPLNIADGVPRGGIHLC